MIRFLVQGKICCITHGAFYPKRLPLTMDNPFLLLLRFYGF